MINGNSINFIERDIELYLLRNNKVELNIILLHCFQEKLIRFGKLILTVSR